MSRNKKSNQRETPMTTQHPSTAEKHQTQAPSHASEAPRLRKAKQPATCYLLTLPATGLAGEKLAALKTALADRLGCDETDFLVLPPGMTVTPLAHAALKEEK